MDATQTLLSKVREGDWMLAHPSDPATFARPKDSTAKLRRVVKIDVTRDEWSGKVYTLTLDDKRTTEPRYGTTHVYLGKPDMASPEGRFAAGKRVENRGGALYISNYTPVGDEPRIERTPQGRDVRIHADGRIELVDEPAPISKGHVPIPRELQATDEEADAALEGEPSTDGEKCEPCRGLGLVRKYGKNKGGAYKTLNGAQAALANGNAEDCPNCGGLGLTGVAA